jgi:glyoxylase-like metal-dependent hydrolase (beta-lactamase superfamily II)/rhodanese-related sulfurtransferase
LKVKKVPFSRLSVKQFRWQGCLSHLVFDPDKRHAVFIDPHRDLIAEYREFVAENRLQPELVIDTQTHSDHRSATHLLKNEYPCEIGMSRIAESQRPDRRLNHGERLSVGTIEIEILATPGHSPDAISLFFPELGAVFTGDTLLIGGAGHTCFQGADASALWTSLHEVLGKLPGSTLVFPSRDSSQLICSTIDTEKWRNPQLSIPTREAFIEFKRQEAMNWMGSRDLCQKNFNYNSEKSPEESNSDHPFVESFRTPREKVGRFSTLSVQKYAPKLQENAEDSAFLDVREVSEFQNGHLPGTENIPLSTLGLAWPRLKKAKRIYVSCLSGKRSESAAETLTYLGHSDVVSITGGFKAWVAAGMKVEK